MVGREDNKNPLESMGQNPALRKKVKRSPWFNRIGHTLAALVGVIFILTFARAIYEFEFWNTYLFDKAVDYGDSCEVAASRSPSATPPSPADFKAIKLPHTPGAIAEMVPAPKESANTYIHAEYRCQIDTVRLTGKGAAYLHIGWLVAEQATVAINGQLRASFAGTDKIFILLTSEEVAAKSIALTVRAHSQNDNGFGIRGLTPFVVAEGTASNSSILGLETFLQVVRPLYRLLPILTLGIILVVGWFGGLRQRVLVVSFLYIAFASITQMLAVYSHFWPWPLWMTFGFYAPFKTGTRLAFLIFGMEVIGLNRSWITKLTVGTIVLVMAEVAYLAIYPSGVEHVVILRKALLSVGCIYLLIKGVHAYRQGSSETIFKKGLKRAGKVVLVLNVMLFCGVWIDYALKTYLNKHIQLVNYLDMIFPLLVGGIILYMLYLVERNLREEKAARAKMEGELGLAAKLQDILIPEERAGVTHGIGYELETVPHEILGGDWIKVHKGRDKSLFVLGDVVGKGASAALTHSGIAAAWESQIRQWDEDKITAEELLQKINKTMFDLFKGNMNTTFAIAEVHKSGKVRIAAGGNYWLHLGRDKSVPILSQKRTLLGIKSEFQTCLQEIDLVPGDWLVCFTDGVLEGHRPIKKFLRAIGNDFADLNYGKIRERLRQAAMGAVHPDDASTLILHYSADPADTSAA